MIFVSWKMKFAFLCWTTLSPSVQCPSMSEFRTILAVRKPHIHFPVSLAIVHAVMIAAVTLTVIISAPIYS